MKKIIKNKIARRLFYSFIILVIISQISTSCLQFRMNATEVNEYFEDEQLIPELIQTDLEGGQTISLAYQDNNMDTTVVFIHGAPGSWSAFIDFMKLSDLRARVNIVSVDRPGYGFSDFGDPVVSLYQQSKMIMQAVSKIESKNLIVVGHSLGGPVAAKMLMDYPEQINGAILVAPSIDPDLENREWYRYIGKLRLIKYLIPKTFWVTNEEIYDLKQELIDLKEGWVSIKKPVIVIQGTKDNLVPMENAYFAKKMLADSVVTINMLEGANHFIPWTHPQEITNAIFKLLTEK